ncbi:MAG TPA: proline--tRNA ligase [Ignavibacteria bacterium]|nr:proline--tRNA ligase [Ignavibacteria bacterium]
MKLSQFFIPTLKDDPVDAVVSSHKLMLRAGMIKQLTAGVYSYLPFGLLVIRKVENIIREEMNAIGGNEFLLPALSPNDLWAQTGRLEDYGDLMFRIKNRELVLGPTHEEVFTSIAKPSLISYKDLPQVWYQIQTKFRNEDRPRAGVLRAREFTMKDAYSFDATLEQLDKSYNDMAVAYRNIFRRCGFSELIIVSAFSGAMGGSDSEEFMIPSDAGEDNIAVSEDGKYASNVEVAESYKELVARKDSDLAVEKFHTPNIKTIDELADFVKTKDKTRLAKSRVFVNALESGNEYILALICGDDEFNEKKLEKYFGMNIRPANNDELMEITGADAGSIGPVGLKGLKNKKIKIIADNLLKDADELISGANENDQHYRNIDMKRDVPDVEYFDLRIVKEGEETIDRKSKLKITKAVEVGHIYKLGTKYAKALGATFLDAEGKENPLIMGSYGIGVQRTVASFIEESHDEKGIIWKGEIAPFKVNLISLMSKDENAKNVADEFYKEFKSKNIEILFDDRADVRPGVKFNDADLIGIPVQLIIGEKNLKDGNLEIKIRSTGERLVVKKEEALNKIMELLKG